MAGPPDQEPKPAGCGCRWLWHIVVFLVLVFLLWLQRDNIPSAISDLRSEITPLIERIFVTTEPGATNSSTPTIASPLAPPAISSPTPGTTVAVAPAAMNTPTPTSLAPTISFLLGDFENGLWLEQQDPDLALAIKNLVWAQDGINIAEYKAIQGILYAAVGSRPTASSLISRNWVQDGIDGAEAELITHFAYLVRTDSSTALRILRMPFLKTIEPPDASAMEALSMLAVSDTETFRDVLSHPALTDGISNDLAPIVATLHGVAGTNPALIEVLLDPNRVVLELRTITLPLSGEVVLTIIRTGPGATRSMDLLESAVRGAEEATDAPLPTNYVGLLFENAVSGSSAGTNFGTHIAIRPEFDDEDDTGKAVYAGLGIAHEVAHYYWYGNADWIDEGAADFVATIIETARTGRPLVVGRPPCAYAGSISELESLEFERGDAEFQCNYSLGLRLFMDLHRTLGAERFRQGFRELYLASKAERDAHDYPTTSLGIGQVKEAFRSDDGAAEIVIARWYDNTEPYDLSNVDRSQADPSLPSINGRIEEAYLTAGEDGPRVSSFSTQGAGDWLVLSVEYSHSLSGGPYEIPIEILEYYEDGFALHRESGALTAEPGYIEGTMRLWVGMAPSRKWAPGHYAVFVYAGGRRVAEVYYEVTP